MCLQGKDAGPHGGSEADQSSKQEIKRHRRARLTCCAGGDSKAAAADRGAGQKGLTSANAAASVGTQIAPVAVSLPAETGLPAAVAPTAVAAAPMAVAAAPTAAVAAPIAAAVAAPSAVAAPAAAVAPVAIATPAAPTTAAAAAPAAAVAPALRVDKATAAAAAAVTDKHRKSPSASKSKGSVLNAGAQKNAAASQVPAHIRAQIKAEPDASRTPLTATPTTMEATASIQQRCRDVFDPVQVDASVVRSLFMGPGLVGVNVNASGHTTKIGDTSQGRAGEYQQGERMEARVVGEEL